MDEIREGYIIDYISGLQVKETPEEVEAIQPFSKILVDDYGYPKSHVHTRPQYRVKVRPSDTKKEYPVDIAVFSSETHDEDNVYIIVECKKKNRKDGRSQLEDYLRFSKAYLGVWFNGEERLYLQKIEKDGKILFDEIPNIPRYGERVEDIGKFKRKDLRPAENLKPTFRTIRNYLAANAVGITRDEVFASQIINLIFCKIYDERFTRPNDTVKFRAGINEKDEDVRGRILELFEKVKHQYNDVIDVADSISLDAKCIKYIVGELQLYSLKDSSRDAVGEAFEIFIGPSLKGAQGQFFTPRNVVNMVIRMIDPDTDEKILDPACGSGGFLVESLRYVWGKLEEKATELGWPEAEIEAEKQKVAMTSNIILAPRLNPFWNIRQSVVIWCSRTASVYRVNSSFCSFVMVTLRFASFLQISSSSFLYSLQEDVSYSVGSILPYQSSSRILILHPPRRSVL